MFLKRFSKIVLIVLFYHTFYNFSLFAGTETKCLSCLGVYPFQNISTTSKAGVLVSQIFYDELYAKTDWKIFNWDTVLRSQELVKKEFKEIISNKDIADLGRKIGLKMILYGTVIKYGYRPLRSGAVIPEIVINMKVIDCSTGRIVSSSVISSNNSSLLLGNQPLVYNARLLISETVTKLLNTYTKKCSCNAENKILTIYQRQKQKVKYIRKNKTPLPVKKIVVSKQRKIRHIVLGDREKAIYNLMMHKKSFIYLGARFIGKTTNLLPESNESLIAIGNVMKAYPNIKIKILAHTDSTGDKTLNKIITEKQANLLKDFLIHRVGISSDRIIAEGVGDKKPIVPNINKRNQEKNRRIEIVILSK